MPIGARADCAQSMVVACAQVDDFNGDRAWRELFSLP